MPDINDDDFFDDANLDAIGVPASARDWAAGPNEDPAKIEGASANAAPLTFEESPELPSGNSLDALTDKLADAVLAKIQAKLGE